MDGLDEYQASRRHDITNIMNGSTFKHVIITTLPEAARGSKNCKKYCIKKLSYWVT